MCRKTHDSTLSDSGKTGFSTTKSSGDASHSTPERIFQRGVSGGLAREAHKFLLLDPCHVAFMGIGNILRSVKSSRFSAVMIDNGMLCIDGKVRGVAAKEQRAQDVFRQLRTVFPGKIFVSERRHSKKVSLGGWGQVDPMMLHDWREFRGFRLSSRTLSRMALRCGTCLDKSTLFRRR
jgi:hypothetical protein